MNGLLARSAYWDWWLLGLVLIILEMLLPGTFMVWLGSAALVVGLLVLLFPDLGWQWQWLLFALLSLASLSLWWAYFRKHALHSAEPWLQSPRPPVYRPGIDPGRSHRQRPGQGQGGRFDLEDRRPRLPGRNPGAGDRCGRCDAQGGTRSNGDRLCSTLTSLRR